MISFSSELTHKPINNSRACVNKYVRTKLGCSTPLI
jgi:hypothetical protein